MTFDETEWKQYGKWSLTTVLNFFFFTHVVISSMFKTSIIKRCLPSIFETGTCIQASVFFLDLSTQAHSCIPKQIAIQIERYPVFIYKFEQKLMKEKEKKKLASSILLLRKRSNHYHLIFAGFSRWTQ